MQGCPHCHAVIDRVLPPLQQKYGDQLEIHLIEISTQDDIEQFYKIAAAYGIPHERAGVPFLIIGDHVLIGDKQIPTELPDLIEEYLAAGGVDYPNDPSLAGLLPPTVPAADACEPNTPCADQKAQRQGTPTPAATGQTRDATHQPPATPSPAQPKSNGFTLAIAIMAVMVGAVVYTGVAVARGPQDTVLQRSRSWSDIAVPILTLAGVGVAGYLAYVEMRSAKAICGPVGDCNAVQSSPYARMFGVLPVGVLGMLGYIAILVVWLWGRLSSNRWARYAPLVMFGMTLFGVLFSLYLTYLEPFVIRAVCAWCLTSAVIMTLLLLLSVGPAVRAVAMLDSKE